jgi:hypothetical protein
MEEEDARGAGSSWQLGALGLIITEEESLLCCVGKEDKTSLLKISTKSREP